MKTLIVLAGCLLTAFSMAARESTDLLPDSTFTPGMEGPAVDKAGHLYAANYVREGTIGIVYPDSTSAVYVTLPEGSTGNGIRFDQSGRMYIADYTGHNILRVEPETREITVFAHDPQMNQPNDLAIAPDGTIYASDPDWTHSTGQLWMVATDGTVTNLRRDMGTTNGIEVSPDGHVLYVGESVQRRILAFEILPDGTLGDRRIFCTFSDYGLDGMRCDTEGNLYITRYDKGTVVIFSPEGKQLREVELKGKRPSNLAFGGPDRKRCYVTMADRGCFECFEAEFAGRE